METVFLIIELLGCMAFSASGAITAIKKELDLVGVIIIALITTLGGGLIRDIVLGITPPNMFVNKTYYLYELVAVAVAALIFTTAYITNKKKKSFADKFINNSMFLIDITDALGLSIFCVSSVKLAVNYGFYDYKILLVFVGVITGTGGGIFRDLLVREIPIIFRKYVYAVPATLGTLFYIVFYNRMNNLAAMLIGIVIIAGIRILAIIYKWNFPTIKKEQKLE